MKTSLIIHGHFYQPPRENPFTGIIPLQSSAKPFENWNENIYRSCYLPNAYSRYLNSNGNVVDITNNYCHISANFGPTLLSWIEAEHPQLMEKIREADRESISRTGHSNIMAQCYNHTILPLDSPRTRRIEVAWAIEDYKFRFGHKPEGFWCSECAINADTIDILAEYGIKYTVLSPWQAVAIDGVKLGDKPAPCDRPFIIKGKKKQIAAFFYDPDYASGISFGHMLRNADSLYEQILKTVEERNNPALLHWATDGEIYGHHEAFGDMALAALIKKISKSEDIELTNYGAFLESHPATEVATLSAGDDGLGSSWSCCHGVGRWYRDCGCHTGGDDKWNQKWRTPLREAFRNLEKRADAIFYPEVTQILGNRKAADTLLERYGSVVCGRRTAEQFMSVVKKDNGASLDNSEKVTLAVLLNAMCNVFYTFCSCGWFFNDISGIEPRQNISYAVYASEMLQDFTVQNLLQALLSDLREAQSNIVSEGTGEDIARHDLPKIPAFAMAAGFFAMNRTLALQADYKDSYGVFRLESINSSSMTVRNTRTLRQFHLHYKTTADKSGLFHISVKNKGTGYVYTYTGKDITQKSLNSFSNWVENKLASCLEGPALEKLTQNIENYSMLINTDRSLLKSGVFYENMSLCIKAIKCMLIQNRNIRNRTHIEYLRRLAWFARLSGVSADVDNIREIFNLYMDRFTAMVEKGTLSDRDAEILLGILIAAREEGYNPDITMLQNAVFPLATGKTRLQKLSDDTLRTLAGQLNFSYLQS